MLGLFRRFRFFHPQTPNVYSYTPTEYPTPGTGNLAFHTHYGLPIQSVNGAGTRAGMFLVTQAPQVFQNLALPADPLQGIPAGFLSSMPLTDNPIDNMTEQ